MMMHGVAFTATDVASQIFIFLKANYLNCLVMAELLNQVISKGLQVCK